MCRATCTVAFPAGMTGLFTAAPEEGTICSHWEGADDVDGRLASVTMTSERTVTVSLE